MVPRTRRHLLQIATAVAGGFAGCSGLSGDAVESSETENGNDGPPPNDSETDPPMVLLRADTERPPLRIAPEDGEETANRSRRYRHTSHIETHIVDSASKGQRLTVADGLDGAEIEAFVAETDFDSETLYLETGQIRECFRLRLCQISWSADEIETDYVRRLRPYEERCSADTQVFESRLIRLPVGLDERSVNTYGKTIGGRDRCGGGGARAEEAGGRSEAVAPIGRFDGGGR